MRRRHFEIQVVAIQRRVFQDRMGGKGWRQEVRAGETRTRTEGRVEGGLLGAVAQGVGGG